MPSRKKDDLKPGVGTPFLWPFMFFTSMAAPTEEELKKNLKFL